VKAGYATRAARALGQGGETIHAIESERSSALGISFCNVNLTPMDGCEFDPDSAFACRRCIRRICKLRGSPGAHHEPV